MFSKFFLITFFLTNLLNGIYTLEDLKNPQKFSDKMARVTTYLLGKSRVREVRFLLLNIESLFDRVAHIALRKKNMGKEVDYFSRIFELIAMEKHTENEYHVAISVAHLLKTETIRCWKENPSDQELVEIFAKKTQNKSVDQLRQDYIKSYARLRQLF